MMRVATIAATVSGAFLFGRWITLAQLMEILQPLVVALSIMAAALLVRLNRGMPTLDWKSLEPEERKLLTQRIVELSKQYLLVLILQTVALLSLLGLALVNNADAQFLSEDTWQTGIVSIAGGLLTLCFIRMAYIVWRDLDIVRLQKKLIDDSADKEAMEKASQDALTTVNSIRDANLKRHPVSEPSRWPEDKK